MLARQRGGPGGGLGSAAPARGRGRMSGRAGGGPGAGAVTSYNVLTTSAAGRTVDSGAVPAVDRARTRRGRSYKLHRADDAYRGPSGLQRGGAGGGPGTAAPAREKAEGAAALVGDQARTQLQATLLWCQ